MGKGIYRDLWLLMVKKDNIGVQDLRIQDEGKGLSGFGLGIWGVWFEVGFAKK